MCKNARPRRAGERYIQSVTPDDLRWDDLRYFLAAVRAKTLAGAARAQGVEHTTIGRRITALERALGAPLVTRRPDGLHLTRLGAKLAPLVEQMERSTHAIRDRATTERGRVRFAMPTGFSQFFTPHFERLREEHAEISIEILGSSRLVDLKNGEADLALRVGPTADEDLVTRKVGDAGWSLYASPSYLARRPTPRTVTDLSGHEIIAYDPSLASVPGAQWLDEHAGRAKIVLRCREMVEMLASTASGMGLAVLPCVLASTEATLVRLTPDVLATRSISLVFRRDAVVAPPLRAVMRLVTGILREHAALFSGVTSPRK
jgi:DNA-binding transcriptional LysR family regulator